MFRPRSVAVVGASATPSKAGHAMMRALDGFAGELYPVNPRGGQVLGRGVWPSLRAVPEPVDLAVLVVPPSAVADTLEDAAHRGVRAAVVCAGGFAESGPDGARVQSRAVAVAQEAGIRLLGPNTSGFMNPADRTTANFMPAVTDLVPGSVAVVAQSGGVNLAVAFMLAGAGVGLRLGVGLGNAADVDFADVLDYLAEDEATTAVGLHVEGVSDGPSLMAALRRTVARKPVVAFKVGRSDVAEFARSHTGSLTGSYALTRAALTQAGAVVVDSLEELVAALQALRSLRLPPAGHRRPGIGVVTGQAGPGLVIADALGSRGIELPALSGGTLDQLAQLLPPLTFQRNPVDTGRPSATFPGVLRAVAADDGISVLGVYALDEPGALDPVTALAPVAGRVLFGSGGPEGALDSHRLHLDELGVPFYTSPGDLAVGLAALVADAQGRTVTDAPPITPTRSAGPPLDEDEAKTLLGAAGVRTPERRVAADRAAAHAALSAIGGPVAVKVLDTAVLHKTEVGGVHLGIHEHAALDAALDAIDLIPGRHRYLLEAMAPAGPELIVGGIRDATFGPVVLLGLGGVGVELSTEPLLRLAPLSAERAREMVDALPPEVLGGFRGAVAVDRTALAELLRAVSTVLTEHGDIAEIDLNPVRLVAGEPVALDVVVVGRAAKEDHDRHIS
jgi:acetyltransferase